jgi:hypothetical protein
VPDDEKERARIEIVRSIKMEHVGDDAFRAAKRHEERIKDLHPEAISVEEAGKIFDAMLYTIPKD